MKKNENQNKSLKKEINLQKKALFNDIFEWISGIEQDFPIPYETKNVYFIVAFSSGNIELSYSADEKKLSFFDFGFYCPLEAEFLDSQKLKDLSKHLAQKKTKQFCDFVFLLLKELCFSVADSLDFLKYKNIFFGERFQNIP